MKLTLLSKQEYNTVTLPKKCVGQYWVRGKNTAGKITAIIAVEARRSNESNDVSGWYIKSNRRFKLLDKNDQEISNILLNPLELYRIQSVDGNLRFVLYTEPLNEDRKRYKAYELVGIQATLKIGRDTGNNIIYTNRFVSNNHAELTLTHNGVSIWDLESANNTYINGTAVESAQLNTGDVIYIMGMQIVTSGRYIFVNNPDGNVTIQSNDLREYRVIPTERTNPDADDAINDDYEDVLENYFYRAPRFKYGVDVFEFNLDAPPADQSDDNVPLIMLIGPSMTMGMAAMATGTFAVMNAIGRGDITSAIPSIIMSVSMLLGTLLWPLITKSYQRRMKTRKEAKRQETYKHYLVKMEEIIVKETKRQEQILRDNDVNTETYVERILSPVPQIWERVSHHTDFLSLRLGYGDLPLKADIKYMERKFTVEEDSLTEAMYNFGEQKRWLNNVPVCLSLAKKHISGVFANKQTLYAYAKNLILQLVALHSYEDVKLVLVYDENDAPEFTFTRWLPHTMNNERTVRYIATNFDEAKELSVSLDAIIEQRKQLNEVEIEGISPHFVIICLDNELASKTECVRRILEHKGNIYFSVLSMFGQLKDLPKECVAVVEVLEGLTGNLTYIGDVSAPPIPFNMDSFTQIDMNRITNVLANTMMDSGGSHFVLPKKYTFFEMLEIGKIEHLNLVDNWSVSDPVKSLAAVVGVDRYGEAFKLDLHERAHGPHGLVAGMTGSGKSEFIISYILSMAVNFSPYEVAFILIDYKGGGMAKSFENIPHTAGIITNLDGNAIKRSLVSMRSELHRRERIFRDVSAHHSISNIDIYKYQKLYRQGKVNEPLPHLFIVSDEFAELKKEQPDFMTELTSTARVGRSLGVHLILATQKPGGVVDDQIRSNSRFRVCLKVQDTGDSQEMLGRPEAAALVDTGRFYLQVGYNEIFEIGQSAWAGAPYYPSAKVIKDLDDAVSIINTNGRIIAEANTDRFAMIKDPPKQLDVITGYISKVCKDEQIKWWKMWLDPIPGLVYADELTKKYNITESKYVLNPIIGEYDNPSHQSQGVLRVPITAEGNVIIYGSAGNGKEMFLETLCYSLISKHTPQEVNIYMLDFGAEMLTAFSKAPHIGDVIFSYESEKVSNLFKMMYERLETRKKLLADFGGDIFQYNAQADKPEPNIIVIINNYAAFMELYENNSDYIKFLTREGTKYGIYFILTCTGVVDVRFSLLQNFVSLYCLRLNNADEYTSVVGNTGGMQPERHKGRGLFRKKGEDLFEFQTARITEQNPPYGFIREFSAKMADLYPGQKAINVPILPDTVTEQFLAPHATKGNLNRTPVGVEKETLDIAYYNFADSGATLVLSIDTEWQGFVNAIGHMTANQMNIKTMVFAPDNTGMESDDKNLHVFLTADDNANAVHEIEGLLSTRESQATDNTEPVFIIIQSLSSLQKVLERYPYAKNDADNTEETQTSNLSAKLKWVLEKCGKQSNIYCLVAESLGTLSPFVYEKWYTTHINGTNAIWIGNGINTQFRINITKLPPSHMLDAGPGFGFVINKSTATSVKFIQQPEADI
jgi:S-DNA-T family DNA segregation ATPase FtsK/SpoIIIE